MSFLHPTSTRGFPIISREWMVIWIAAMLLLLSLLIVNRMSQPMERTVPQPVLAGSAMLTR